MGRLQSGQLQAYKRHSSLGVEVGLLSTPPIPWETHVPPAACHAVNTSLHPTPQVLPSQLLYLGSTPAKPLTIEYRRAQQHTSCAAFSASWLHCGKLPDVCLPPRPCCRLIPRFLRRKRGC